MRRRRWIALSLAVLAAGTAGCAAFDLLKPHVNRVTPRIQSVDLAGVDMQFDVDVSSPVALTGTEPTLAYTLEIEGEQLASGDRISTQTNAERGIVTAQVPVRVEYADLIRLVGRMANASEVAYRVSGEVDVLGGAVDGSTPVRIPFSTDGKLPVVRVPTISVVDVGTPQFDLSGDASIDVQVRVTNPNAFGFGLAGLGYGLELGGVRLAELTATSNGGVEAGKTRGAALSGVIASADVLGGLFKGGSLDGVRVVPRGRFETPWGSVRLDND
jgi:LEA14-like dessication related protein